MYIVKPSLDKTAEKMPADHRSWEKSWIETPSTVLKKDGWYLIDLIKCERLMAFLPPQGRVLEVGCGAARLSAFMACRGYSVYGLDFSYAALQSALHNFELLKMRGGGIDSPEGMPFICLLSMAVLTLFYPRDFWSILRIPQA